MSAGYLVRGSQTARVREEDALMYVRRAGHVDPVIVWGVPDGEPHRHVAGIFVGRKQIDAVKGDTRADVLLCFVAVYAHEAAGCQCKSLREPCQAALSAAFDIGKGLDS